MCVPVVSRISVVASQVLAVAGLWSIVFARTLHACVPLVVLVVVVVVVVVVMLRLNLWYWQALGTLQVRCGLGLCVPGNTGARSVERL